LRYSVPEVARLLGISERAIRKRIDTNQLFAVKEDRAWVVLLDPDTIPRPEPVPQVPHVLEGGTAPSTTQSAHDVQAGTAGTADVWLSTTVADTKTRESPEPAVLDAAPEPEPAVPSVVPTSADAVPVPPVDLTPLVNLVADLTRRNAELTEAATIWQLRAHDLEQRLKQLGSGLDGTPEPITDDAHDAPVAAPEPLGETLVAPQGSASSWWGRTWRRMSGGD
jgi:hypothetical protein